MKVQNIFLMSLVFILCGCSENGDTHDAEIAHNAEIAAAKAERMKWIRMAAEDGNVDAQVEMGCSYVSPDDLVYGELSPYDEIRISSARYWFEKAAKKDDVRALYMLYQLSSTQSLHYCGEVLTASLKKLSQSEVSHMKSESRRFKVESEQWKYWYVDKVVKPGQQYQLNQFLSKYKKAESEHQKSAQLAAKLMKGGGLDDAYKKLEELKLLKETLYEETMNRHNP